MCLDEITQRLCAERKIEVAHRLSSGRLQRQDEGEPAMREGIRECAGSWTLVKRAFEQAGSDQYCQTLLVGQVERGTGGSQENVTFWKVRVALTRMQGQSRLAGRASERVKGEQRERIRGVKVDSSFKDCSCPLEEEAGQSAFPLFFFVLFFPWGRNNRFAR